MFPTTKSILVLVDLSLNNISSITQHKNLQEQRSQDSAITIHPSQNVLTTFYIHFFLDYMLLTQDLYNPKLYLQESRGIMIKDKFSTNHPPIGIIQHFFKEKFLPNLTKSWRKSVKYTLEPLQHQEALKISPKPNPKSSEIFGQQEEEETKFFWIFFLKLLYF